MSYLIDANVNNVKVSGNTDPYTLTSTDEIFLAQDNQIVILPEPTIVNKGRTYTIKLNGSFTSGVFVRNHLSSLIYTINKDYGTVNIISDGTTWVVLADAIQVSEIATTTYVQETTWNNVGAWNGIDTYNAKDVVSYEGSSWLALQTSTNSTPVEGADWTLIASKGDQGLQGLQGDAGADGVSIVSSTIIGGDLFIEYSNDLGNPTNVGTVVGADGADAVWYFQGAWSNATNYVLGDVVTYNGSSWYALQANNNSAPVEGANWTLIASKGDSYFVATGVDLSLTTSNATSGGDLTFITGDGTSGQGGSTTFTLGESIDVLGGSFQVNAGDSTYGGGGAISLYSGNTTGGAGGSLLLEAGDTYFGTNGGNVTINAGFGNIGTGGSVNLTAGYTKTGNAGGISLTTGDALTLGNGGNLTLQTGTGFGATKNAGNIILNPGDAGNGAIAGNVQIQSDMTVTGAIDVNTITLGDNEASALDITESTNSYLKFVTTNGSEKVIVGKELSVVNADLNVKDGSNNTVFNVESTTGDTNISGNLTVTGSLIVNGSTTTINTVNLNVTDSLIQLADGVTGAPVNDAGFIIARGDENNASLFWNENSDTFIFATATSLNSDFSGDILIAGGTITYSAVRLGSLEANSISGITGGSTLSVTGDLIGNADTSSSWLNPMTLNLGGDLSGSIAFDGSSTVTLNATLGTVSIANLEYSSINIGGSDFALGGTLNLENLAITGSTLGLNIGSGVITNANLENSSINIGGSNIALGGTLNLSSDFAFDGGTLVLGGTLSVYSTGAIALAKTINLAGAITGSINLNDQTSAVTLNTSYSGTITNADLEYSSINIDGVNFALGGTLNVAGDSYITLGVTGSTLSASLSTIDNAQLEYSSINIGGSNISLGGTLNLENLAITGSTLGLNIGNNVITNANLVNDSINIGGSNISLGGTINLDGGLSVTGSTLSVGNVATSSSWLNAMTLSIGGTILTGSISFNGSSPVTLIADVVPNSITGGMIANATITNSNLINDSINIDGVDFTLGSTLNVTGDSYITLGVTGTTLSASLSTIDNAILENDSVRIGSFDLALGGTLNLENLAITGSTLGLNIGSAVITNTNLVNDSVSIGGSFDLALGGTLNLENLAITGSTLSLATTINLTDEAVNALEFTEGANTYLKFITTGGAEEVYLGKPVSLSQINLTDNQATALDITESTNSYLKFVTTDAGEKVVVGKTLDLSEGNIINVGSVALDSISADGSSIAINLTDNQASALDITEGANSYLKFVTTNSSEKLEVRKTLKLSDDLYVLDKPEVVAQTLYLYVKYNATSQGDNEYFYIFRTPDGGATREVVPLSNLSNLQEDTSLGYKRYIASQTSAYTNTTPTATPNASFIIDTAYTYYFIIRTDYDDTTPNKDFEAYVSTSNAKSNPTYNDVLPYGGGFSDDGEGNKYAILIDSSSWVYSSTDAPVTVANRSSDPVSSVNTFIVDNATGNTTIKGDTTIQTDSSLLINKATSASDSLIILNSDTTLTAHQDAVISVERGSGTDAKLKWDNTNTLWSADNATGNARPLILASPIDTSITTSTPVSLTGNAKGEYEKVYLVANSATSITINLFALGGNYDGYKVIIKKIDSGVGTITITPNGTDNIDGSNSSITISTAFGGATLIAQGSNWWVI